MAPEKILMPVQRGTGDPACQPRQALIISAADQR